MSKITFHQEKIKFISSHRGVMFLFIETQAVIVIVGVLTSGLLEQLHCHNQ
jgi:hypothetical protein